MTNNEPAVAKWTGYAEWHMPIDFQADERLVPKVDRAEEPRNKYNCMDQETKAAVIEALRARGYTVEDLLAMCNAMRASKEDN